MKKFIAFSLVAFSSVSFAAERKIYDVMYLPKQGTIYGFSVANYTATNQYESSEKTDVNGYKLEQTVGYSVLSNLTLNLSMNYVNYLTDTKTGDNFEQTGLSDLDLNARFRVMEGDSDLDIIAYGQLGLGDHEVKSDGDVDNKTGGNTVGLGAQWGQRKESFQWAVLGRVDRLMEASTEDKQSDVDYDRDAHNRYLLQGDILGRMSEKLFFRGALSAQVTDGYEIEGLDIGSMNEYKISGELQHLCSENLLARVGVSNSHVEFNGIDQFTVWNFLAGANYQF